MLVSPSSVMSITHRCIQPSFLTPALPVLSMTPKALIQMNAFIPPILDPGCHNPQSWQCPDDTVYIHSVSEGEILARTPMQMPPPPDGSLSPHQSPSYSYWHWQDQFSVFTTDNTKAYTGIDVIYVLISKFLILISSFLYFARQFSSTMPASLIFF